MEKLLPKSFLPVLALFFLAVGGIIILSPGSLAKSSGAYLSADLSGADLMGIISNHPNISLVTLIILLLLAAGYCVYLLMKKKETN